MIVVSTVALLEFINVLRSRYIVICNVDQLKCSYSGFLFSLKNLALHNVMTDVNCSSFLHALFIFESSRMLMFIMYE
jgi:hypothetical protein